jgi:hypothetical protein
MPILTRKNLGLVERPPCCLHQAHLPHAVRLRKGSRLALAQIPAGNLDFPSSVAPR